MHILIAGGTGMIGRALTEEFLKEGWVVTILSRKPGKSTIPNLKYLEWDGINLGDWQNCIKDIDAIINLSGESIGGSSLLNLRWTRARKTRILQSRINAGRILTEAMKNSDKRPEVFIQASAVGYYGVKSRELLTEESPEGNDFLAEVCEIWETSSKEVEEMGVRRVVARLGVVIGKQNPIIGYMSLPYKLYLGGRLGNGKQYLTWIHIKDVVRIFIEMLENKNYKGTYNISAPKSNTNIEVSEILGKSLKRPNWLPVPAFILRFALGEASTLVLDGQNVQPKRLLEIGYEFKFPELKTAMYDVLVKNKYIQLD